MPPDDTAPLSTVDGIGSLGALGTARTPDLRHAPVPAGLVVLAAALALTAPLPMAPADAVRPATVVGVAAVVWVAQLLWARRRPAVPLAVLAAVGVVLAYGALLVVNAGHRYDVASQALTARPRLVDWLPGGVDRRAGTAAWLQLATVLVAGVVLVDQARRAVVRAGLLWVLATAGGLLGALGALDRFGLGPVRFRQLPQSGTHFAVFEYHGNAAAFLNLALPAAVVLAVRSWDASPGRTRSLARALATAATAGTMIGCATHVSKAGQVLTAVTVLALAAALRRSAGATAGSPSTGRPTRPARRRWALVAGLSAVTLAVGAAGAIGAGDRWRELPSTLSSDNGRVLTWQVALHTWERAPLVGNGPGSFKLLLPGVTRAEVPELFRHWIVQPYEPDAPTTIWMRVHNDPLEVLVEWGPLGLAALLVVFVAPLAAGVPARLRGRAADAGVTAAGCVALGVLGLHALGDFPLQILPIQLAAAAWGAVVLGAARPTPVAAPTPESTPGWAPPVGPVSH